jgi:hypothetical protein
MASITPLSLKPMASTTNQSPDHFPTEWDQHKVTANNHAGAISKVRFMV